MPQLLRGQGRLLNGMDGDTNPSSLFREWTVLFRMFFAN